MATFDLNSLNVDDTTTVELVHPTTGDEIKGVSITVYGQDSETYKAEQRKAEFQFAEYMRKHRNKPMPPEQREAMDKRKAVACIKSVNGLVNDGVPVTAEAAMDVPWIFEQVTAAIFDRALFIKG